MNEEYGDLTVEVEYGKKENRSDPQAVVTLRHFLSQYNSTDMYSVSDVANQMLRDLNLLECMREGGFSHYLLSVSADEFTL